MARRWYAHLDPLSMGQFNPTTLLVVLSVLSAYLITGALVVNRISPPIFFTVSLTLLAASFTPTTGVAAVCVGLTIFADAILAIDHIHGHCAYEVMVGGSSWHQDGLGDLHWYRQCVQPANAFWIMAALGLVWLSIFVSGVTTWYRNKKGRIELAQEEDGGALV